MSVSVSVIVATYGGPEWMELGWERAVRSLRNPAEFVMEHQPDGNISTSRNSGAAKACSDWLCFLDADDELAPGFIGAMERAVERNPGGRVLLTPAVQIVRGHNRQSAPTFFKEVDLRHANWLVVGTLVHRDLFWEVGGFDDYPHGFEDWSLWSKCARVGAEVVKVPDAVYRYWANPQSKHRQGWRDKKTQVATHNRVAAELDEWEAARV